MAVAYAERLMQWDHITPSKLLALGGTMVLGHLYIFDFLGSLPSNSRLLQAHDACILGCHSAACTQTMAKGRDPHYYPGQSHAGCAFTVWELTHFLFHAGVGFFFNLPISLFISVSFELWEHYTRDCGSFLDLAYNGLGCLLGVWLSVVMRNKFPRGKM